MKGQIIQQKVESIREIKANEGDLVLLVKPEHGLNGTVILGVFHSYSPPKKLFLKKPIILRPYEDFGGQEILGVERYPLSEFDEGNAQFTLNKTMSLYLEPEECARGLRQLPRFRKHAEWVEKLEKPYIRE